MFCTALPFPSNESRTASKKLKWYFDDTSAFFLKKHANQRVHAIDMYNSMPNDPSVKVVKINEGYERGVLIETKSRSSICEMHGSKHHFRASTSPMARNDPLPTDVDLTAQLHVDRSVRPADVDMDDEGDRRDEVLAEDIFSLKVKCDRLGEGIQHKGNGTHQVFMPMSGVQFDLCEYAAVGHTLSSVVTRARTPAKNDGRGVQRDHQESRHNSTFAIVMKQRVTRGQL